MERVAITSKIDVPYKELPLRSMLLDTSLKMYFDTREERQRARDMLALRCPACVAAAEVDDTATAVAPQRSWAALKAHIKAEHRGQHLCDTCLRNRKIFTHEQRLYDDAGLRRHMSHGEPSDGILSAVEPHPKCEYCSYRLFDQDAYVAHMKEAHEICELCHRGGEFGDHFRNWHQVVTHMQRKHFTCRHPACQDALRARRFADAAFLTELDLHAHRLEKHRDEMTAVEAEATGHSLLGFSYGGPAEDTGFGSGARRGGRARERGRGRRGGRGGGRDGDRGGGDARRGRHGAGGAGGASPSEDSDGASGAHAGVSRRAEQGAIAAFDGALARVQNGMGDMRALNEAVMNQLKEFAKQEAEPGENPHAKFDEFRAMSGRFRRGEVNAREFFYGFRATFGVEATLDVLPRLAALLPDADKRESLRVLYVSFAREERVRRWLHEHQRGGKAAAGSQKDSATPAERRVGEKGKSRSGKKSREAQHSASGTRGAAATDVPSPARAAARSEPGPPLGSVDMPNNIASAWRIAATLARVCSERPMKRGARLPRLDGDAEETMRAVLTRLDPEEMFPPDIAWLEACGLSRQGGKQVSALSRHAASISRLPGGRGSREVERAMSNAVSMLSPRDVAVVVLLTTEVIDELRKRLPPGVAPLGSDGPAATGRAISSGSRGSQRSGTGRAPPGLSAPSGDSSHVFGRAPPGLAAPSSDPTPAFGTTDFPTLEGEVPDTVSSATPAGGGLDWRPQRIDRATSEEFPTLGGGGPPRARDAVRSTDKRYGDVAASGGHARTSRGAKAGPPRAPGSRASHDHSGSALATSKRGSAPQPRDFPELGGGDDTKSTPAGAVRAPTRPPPGFIAKSPAVEAAPAGFAGAAARKVNTASAPAPSKPEVAQAAPSVDDFPALGGGRSAAPTKAKAAARSVAPPPPAPPAPAGFGGRYARSMAGVVGRDAMPPAAVQGESLDGEEAFPTLGGGGASRRAPSAAGAWAGSSRGGGQDGGGRSGTAPPSGEEDFPSLPAGAAPVSRALSGDYGDAGHWGQVPQTAPDSTTGSRQGKGRKKKKGREKVLLMQTGGW